MANFNGMPRATVEYLPNWTSKISTNVISSRQMEETSGSEKLISGIEKGHNRYVEYPENNTSNLISYDDILRDIIETSKNHNMANQVQHHFQCAENASQIPFYHTGNLYQNLANITAAFPGYYPSYSQSINLPNYNFVNSNYENSLASNFNDNYETLIETIYESADGTEHLPVNVEADSTSTNQMKVTNSIEEFQPVQQDNQQVLLQDENQQVYTQQPYLSPFHFLQSSSESQLQSSQQYDNQFIQTPIYQNPLNISLFQPPQIPRLSAKHLVHNNTNRMKVFSPKVVSRESNCINSVSNTVARGSRTFSNNMPPPFSVSSTSAFNPYRKKNKKKTFSNNYINATPTTFKPAVDNNQETILFEPSNIFVVSEESIHSGEPEWSVEKLYVTNDMIIVRPPIQTKTTIEKPKDEEVEIVCDIDFLNLDSINIVKPIQNKMPTHKKRKQDLKVLEGLENIDFEDDIFVNRLEKSSVVSQSKNKNKSPEIDKNQTKPNKKLNINDSDADGKLEEQKRSITSPIDHNNIVLDIVKNSVLPVPNEEKLFSKPDSECYSLKNIQLKVDSSENALYEKTFKCNICNKTFVSKTNLVKHKKIGHKNSRRSSNKNLKESTNLPIKSITPTLIPKGEENKNVLSIHFKSAEKGAIKNDSFNESSKLNKNISEEKLNEKKKSNKKTYQKSISEKTIDKKSLEENHATKFTKRRKLEDVANSDEGKIEKNCSGVNETGKRKTRTYIISYKD